MNPKRWYAEKMHERMLLQSLQSPGSQHSPHSRGFAIVLPRLQNRSASTQIYRCIASNKCARLIAPWLVIKMAPIMLCLRNQPSRAFRSLFSAAAIAALVAVATPPLVAQTVAAHLIPIPREVHLHGVTNASSALVLVPGDNVEDNQAADNLSTAMRKRGIIVPPNAGNPVLIVRLLRADTPEAKAEFKTTGLAFSPAMHAEGYVLVSKPGNVTIIGATAAGVFYGVQTLKQMLSGHGASASVLTGTIRDWPAMRYRGIDDDLSRGPFPTLAFQKKQIRTFASYKINVYSPYFEDTMQYANDPELAPPGRSLTRAQAQQLVRYAARYHVMIIPEQEAFGHLHNILKYEKYSSLADNPHGSLLYPGAPGTLHLIKNWFTQLAQDYPSPFLHIGADETFALTTGKTKKEVQKRGLGIVYADFLSQIDSTLAPLHRRLLFWGDIAVNNPSAIQKLPKNMIAIPWVYWHEDSYDRYILPFKKAGIETWVAPGDANWSVMYPSGSAALDNISGFIATGQRLGSTGALTTVWNDDGEGLFNEDWFGVLFGAAASWQPGRSAAAPYEAAFGYDFYHDPSGKVMRAEQDLMDATKIFNNSDSVFWVDPWSKAGQAEAAKLRPVLHQTRLDAEQALQLLQQAQAEEPHLAHPDAIRAMELGARRIDFAAMKFQFSDEMAHDYRQIYALRGKKSQHRNVETLFGAITGTNGRCTDLRNGYGMLKNLYRKAWLAENRPAWLDNILMKYNMRMQLWQQRADQFQRIANTWEDTGKMPSPEQVGIPKSAGLTAGSESIQ